MSNFDLFGPKGGAAISPDGVYRYRLWRRWEGGVKRGPVNFVMLNPSTADGRKDDATIRRCVCFARTWGYDRMVVTNLYGLRARDPAQLIDHPDPIGPKNNAYLAETAEQSVLVVAAWGNLGAQREDVGLKILRPYADVYALRLTRDGHPAHPLYLPGHLRPELWKEKEYE